MFITYFNKTIQTIDALDFADQVSLPAKIPSSFDTLRETCYSEPQDDDRSRVLAILEDESACHIPELKNRAFKMLRMPSKVVDSVCKDLRARGQAHLLSCRAPSINKKELTFICDSNADKRWIDRVVVEKARLLGQHYDLSGEVGHHGEYLVASCCEQLGYSEIEIRKEKHGPRSIGLQRREIDIFARHPFAEYYQTVEVKNRRQSVNVDQLLYFKQTTEMAASRWALDLRPALVAPFTFATTMERAAAENIPIALSTAV